MSPITTHVLDTTLGRPAEGIEVVLHRLGPEGQTIEVGHGKTDVDGRIVNLSPAGKAEAGLYRLEFDTAGYFAHTGREGFYPCIEITFQVEPDGGHYHVPLLLSPYGYSTYRGT
jgi:5-hydroxyisourate hydrolase